MNLSELLDAAVAKVVAASAAIGIAVAAARHIIEEKYGSWRVWLRGLVSGVVAGVIAGLLMEGVDLPHAVEIALVCIVVYVADDALQGLRVLGGFVAKDPLDAARRVGDAIRGGRK